MLTKKSKANKPKIQRLKLFEKKKKLITTPIEDSLLSIREMKGTDKYDVMQILNDTKRDYYIGVYKAVFRSWFTYAFITGLLGFSLSLVQSSMPSICLPPFLVTIFLIWKVNRYKRVNRTYTSVDLEMLNMNEQPEFRFKTTEQRRGSQGVYLIFYKKGDSFEEIYNDLSDWDLTSSESETDTKKKKQEDDSNKVLVGYMVYGKQRDELETVCVKELCIHSDYRQRKIAKHFVRRMCNNVFRTYGYTRVTFTASSFHTDIMKLLKKKTNLLKNIQTWTAWTILPGVRDERTVYAFNISDLNKEMS